MPHRNIVLKTVSHEDVKRLIQCLDDDEISMKAVYNTDYDPELNEVE